MWLPGKCAFLGNVTSSEMWLPGKYYYPIFRFSNLQTVLAKLGWSEAILLFRCHSIIRTLWFDLWQPKESIKSILMLFFLVVKKNCSKTSGPRGSGVLLQYGSPLRWASLPRRTTSSTSATTTRASWPCSPPPYWSDAKSPWPRSSQRRSRNETESAELLASIYSFFCVMLRCPLKSPISL